MRRWNNLIPFVPEQPQPSLRRAVLGWLMRLVNSNHSAVPLWYAFKRRLLVCYGVNDGFDAQRIEAPCWHCEDGIQLDGSECWSCESGIHHITRTVLARTWVEGCLFHTPARKLYNDPEFWDYARTRAKSVIAQRITHRPVSTAVATEAMLWIMLLCGQWSTLRLALRCRYDLMTSLGTWWLPFGAIRHLLYAHRQLPLWWSRLKYRLRYNDNDIPF